MSLIAYSEVYEGVLGARDVEAALRGLTQFLIGVPILRPDRATAERFADIRSQLRGRGELLGRPGYVDSGYSAALRPGPREP